MGTYRFLVPLSWLIMVLLMLLVVQCCHGVQHGGGGGGAAVGGNSRSNHSHRRRPGGGGGGRGNSVGVGGRSNSASALLRHHQQDHNEFVSKGKICIGTNGRMSVPSNRDHHYRNLKDRYTNCTYVDGNLELTWLQDENLDLSFLKYIREVTGYVLISHVDIKRIVLPRLQIIRGRTLFKMNVHDDEFSLLVTLSKMFTLELPALRDVLRGSIGLFNNYNLCHIKTINWKEIMTDVNGKYVYVYNFTSPERDCPPCHRNCANGCWGEGEDNCQQFSKENCSPQCYQGRCFGPNPRECCHLFCAGGCTGPKQSDCIACRNFYDDGVCTQECPPMQIYNSATYSWEANPRGKYAYGATCVKNCPEHLLKDNGACVRTCPPHKKAMEGACVPCDGPCPKTCPGDASIHAGNIERFRGCTVIEGDIQILQNTFDGFQFVYPNYTFGDRFPPMHPDRLEVFSTLKEITGFINIQAYHNDFTNLSYFRNLEVIGGRTLHEFFTSLYIVKTSLRSLELRSLKRLNSGTVAILENKHLCFADGINWEKIRKSKANNVMLSNNSDFESCEKSGLLCDKECSRDGCWGSGPGQCLACARFQLEGSCITNCTAMPGIYRSSSTECKRCHPECGSSCHGPGADKCTTCLHYQDGPYCVPQCPINKYHLNGFCQSCHVNCVGGCTGPRNTVGPNGCHSCEKAVMNENGTVDVCLHVNDTCPDGYYYEWIGPQEQETLKPLAGKAICRKCHPRCLKCTGYGFHELVCQQCSNYKKGEQCEDECPSDDYADKDVCRPCDPECRGCKGPGSENCVTCQGFKIFPDESDTSSNSSFRCVPSCPLDYPHRVFPDEGDSYCSNQAISLPSTSPDNGTMIIAGAAVFVFFVAAATTIATYFYCKKVKAKENTIKMTMALTGIEDNEPLRHTSILPNTAQLRIIKETEIRRGNILGYGAFGTVFKGVWIVESDASKTVSKIPVAIKVLQNDSGSSSNNSKEFLSEAYIMASVDHPNLLQLLAVCMTSDMMLITQLMPLGCLLDFVRKNQDKIGSKVLLSWCTQIAKGMNYLEEKRLVHRDLAARNVLVQTPTCVKITDFGLAKLLDTNEENYKADGGKMPIKWLALECIQHRIFTHKSDVWAFGVTVWELLTFGKRPYENVSAKDVPELLEKGERLYQPEIASIDVYVVLVKCWMMDADSRPKFSELADEFGKMMLEHQRYLVMPNNPYRRTYQRPCDNGEMVRNLASTLDTDTQSECEEYLQPKSRAPLHLHHHPHHHHHPSDLSHSTTASSATAPPMTRYWGGHPSSSSPPPHHTGTSDGSCNPQYQNHFNTNRQQLLRLPAAHQSSSGAVHPYPDGGGAGLRDSSPSAPHDEYDSSSGSRRSQQAQLGGGLKLDLPVDEDDYLMPSPQQSQGASTYVDLIDGKSGDESSGGRLYPDFFTSNIDNPEYLLNGEGGGVGSQGGVAMVAMVTPEESSDHEYYNDFDRLQRELQPLQKCKDGGAIV